MALLRPKRARSRKIAACVLSVAGALSAASCFVTIADPARELGAVTGSGGAGGMPAVGGSPSLDSGKRDATLTTCGANEKSCGVACVGIDDPKFGCGTDTCSQCVLNNAEVQLCKGGACAIERCKPDWVDCDGKPENGCETDFGNAESPGPAIALGLKPTIDGDPGDWAAVPRYTMTELCPECDPKQPGGQGGEPIVNAAFDDTDFRAQFRVAWDSFALYVLVQVRDNEITALDPTNPEQQDGIELLLDGFNQGSRGYGPDDHHLFIGALGGAFVERDRPLVLPANVQVKTTVQASCYFVEARLVWSYIMATPHTPKAANIYGFTIAANDWDAPSGDAKSPPVREDQVFSVDPKQSYAFDTVDFGDLKLQ
jgi:Carbohydrate family 9 binding domain-like